MRGLNSSKQKLTRKGKIRQERRRRGKGQGGRRGKGGGGGLLDRVLRLEGVGGSEFELLGLVLRFEACNLDLLFLEVELLPLQVKEVACKVGRGGGGGDRLVLQVL